MKTVSFLQLPDFRDRPVHTSVLLETSFSKEYKSPFPIIVYVSGGAIDFGVDGTTTLVQANDAVTLDGGVPHDLRAREDSIIRLTLAKAEG